MPCPKLLSLIPFLVAAALLPATANAQCVTALSPSGTQTVPPGGGALTFTGAFQANCVAEVSSNVAWAVPATPAVGTLVGITTAVVVAQPNLTGASRSGTLTIGTISIPLTQASAVPCTYSLSPASPLTLSPSGGLPVTVTVTTPSACTWTAASNDSWVSAAGGQTGSGDVVVSPQANNTGVTRTGSLSIAGLTYNVSQAPVTTCASVAPTPTTGTTMPPAGGSLFINWTLPSACAWTASVNAPFTVFPASGTGSAQITVSAPPNTTGGDLGRPVSFASGGATPLVVITQAALQPVHLGGPTTFPAQVGVPFSITYTANGGVGPPYTFSLVGTVPAGISIHPSFGILSGTPTQPGAYSFTVRVTDANGQTDSLTISGTIASLLTISCNQNTGPTQVGVAYNNRCLALGGTPPYTVSLVGLPPGLSALVDASSVTVSGTPTQTGPYSFTARVQDSAFRSATRDFGGTIAAAAPLSITCTPATGPTQVGVAFSSTCTAAGGTPPYVYASAGQVPAGISLAANGTVSGTPTVAGAYSFGVLVTDNNGSGTTVSKTFSGTIAAAANCTPVITFPVENPYFISAPGGTRFIDMTLPASCPWTASH